MYARVQACAGVGGFISVPCVPIQQWPSLLSRARLDSN